MPRPVRRGSSAFARTALALIPFLAPSSASARQILFHIFDLKSNASYDIGKNGATVATVIPSQASAVAYGINATTGDVISVVEGDLNLQPPPPPLFASLTSPDPGCARATWFPSGDPTVVGYTVNYGRRSVAGGQATQYETDVQTSASTIDICQLPQGTYYFAVQARNYAGMTSPYSGERVVEIVVVAVMISAFDARVIDGGVELSWRLESDEAIRGFVIYRGDGDSPAVAVDEMQPGASSYVDRSVDLGASYTYTLAVLTEGGGEIRSFPVTVHTPVPSLALEQNVPNPFNPSTVVPFTLPATSRVIIRVYDVRGARVATLTDRDYPAGRHSVLWGGVGDDGHRVSSGAYFYTLTAGNQTRSRKMVMIK